jgi:hypothetical protein
MSIIDPQTHLRVASEYRTAPFYGLMQEWHMLLLPSRFFEQIVPPLSDFIYRTFCLVDHMLFSTAEPQLSCEDRLQRLLLALGDADCLYRGELAAAPLRLYRTAVLMLAANMIHYADRRKQLFACYAYYNFFTDLDFGSHLERVFAQQQPLQQRTMLFMQHYAEDGRCVSCLVDRLLPPGGFHLACCPPPAAEEATEAEGENTEGRKTEQERVVEAILSIRERGLIRHKRDYTVFFRVLTELHGRRLFHDEAAATRYIDFCRLLHSDGRITEHDVTDSDISRFNMNIGSCSLADNGVRLEFHAGRIPDKDNLQHMATLFLQSYLGSGEKG